MSTLSFAEKTIVKNTNTGHAALPYRGSAAKFTQKDAAPSSSSISPGLARRRAKRQHAAKRQAYLKEFHRMKWFENRGKASSTKHSEPAEKEIHFRNDLRKIRPARAFKPKDPGPDPVDQTKKPKPIVPPLKKEKKKGTGEDTWFTPELEENKEIEDIKKITSVKAYECDLSLRAQLNIQTIFPAAIIAATA